MIELKPVLISLFVLVIISGCVGSGRGIETYETVSGNNELVVAVDHAEETYELNYTTYQDILDGLCEETVAEAQEEMFDISQLVEMQASTICNAMTILADEGADGVNYLEYLMTPSMLGETDLDIPEEVFVEYQAKNILVQLYDTNNLDLLAECRPTTEAINLEVYV